MPSRNQAFWGGALHRDMVNDFIAQHSPSGLADEINSHPWLHGTSVSSADRIMRGGLDIDPFNPTKHGNSAYGAGFYVTRSPVVAHDYANNANYGGGVVEGHVRSRKPVETSWHDLNDLGNDVMDESDAHGPMGIVDQVEDNYYTGRRNSGILRVARSRHTEPNHLANLSLRQFGVDFIHDSGAFGQFGVNQDAGVVLHNPRFRPTRVLQNFRREDYPNRPVGGTENAQP